MSPLTPQELKKHLLEATTSKGRMDTYYNHLGISKRSTAKTRSGPPAFHGIIKDFYDEIKQVALELSTEYDSLLDLQNKVETQENFAESLIDATIEKYGPKIWNDGTSGFETITDEGDRDGVYPRHLIYNNESDRKTIRTFVYCFALKRIRHQMMKSSRSLTVGRANVIAPDPISVEPTRTVTTTSVSPITSESRSPEDIHEYQAPVAPMFPTVNTEGVSSSLVVPQSDNGGASLLTRNNVTATVAHRQLNETVQSGSLHINLDSIDQASNRHSRQREGTGERLPHRKRRRSVRGVAADADSESLQLSEFTGRIVRPKKGPTVDVSPSTSPDIISEVTNNSADQRPMTRASNRTTRRNVSAMASERPQSRIDADANFDSEDDVIAITTQPIETLSSDENMLDETFGELDSVVDSPRPLLTQEEQDEANEPTLIVKPRTQSQEATRQNQQQVIGQKIRYRWLLGPKLLSFFEMPSEQIKVLEEVVTLIEDIKKPDTSPPQNGCSDGDTPDQPILDQWLELVNIYLHCSKDINSIEDERRQDTPRNSHEYNERFKKKWEI